MLPWKKRNKKKSDKHLRSVELSTKYLNDWKKQSVMLNEHNILVIRFSQHFIKFTER